MNEQLQSLNLSDKDFKLIIDGLDALPNTEMTHDLMKEMMIGMLSKDENNLKKRQSEFEEKQRKDKIKKEQYVEDIKILQGKLLMLKRYLQENNALKESYDIINNVK